MILEAMPPRRSLKIFKLAAGKAEPYRTEGGKAATRFVIKKPLDWPQHATPAKSEPESGRRFRES
jgi:hypothetical protein